MVLTRFSKMMVKEGRENIFLEGIGSAKGSFRDDVQKYANGLLNSQGGVLYFGVSKNGTIKGREISRKEEDDYRLTVDHVFGSFQPFVSSKQYQLNFLAVDRKYYVIELKVSVGEVGEIYEDGSLKVYIVDAAQLIGPLHPQELKELILLKYKQSIEGAEEAAKYCTPNLYKARAMSKANKKQNEESNQENRNETHNTNKASSTAAASILKTIADKKEIINKKEKVATPSVGMKRTVSNALHLNKTMSNNGRVPTVKPHTGCNGRTVSSATPCPPQTKRYNPYPQRQFSTPSYSGNSFFPSNNYSTQYQQTDNQYSYYTPPCSYNYVGYQPPSAYHNYLNKRHLLSYRENFF